MHPLLERQLRRAGWTGDHATLEVGKLLALVDDAYRDVDRERLMADRSRQSMNEELTVKSRRITEQAQNRLAAAVDGISAAIALFDEMDRLIVCNRAYRDIHPTLADILRPGVTFEEIVRTNVKRSRFDLGPADAEAWIQKRLEQHRNPKLPVERRLKDGRWEQVAEEALKGGGRILIITDISERKQTEAALVAAMEAAVAASQAKSQFLANMSHELRTPLNAIIGFSEIMEGQLFGPLGDARYVEYSSDILASGRHLLEIINDILDMSKINAGKYELDEAPMSIAKEIEGALVQVRGRAAEEQIETEVKAVERLPELRADARVVRQILINLLSNAIKFTPAGGRVTVSANMLPDRRLRLSVADTGIGMEAADIPKALEPFQQIDGGLARRHKGTGLGLPLCKRLTELHGGELAITSVPGAGTTVTVTFPAARTLGTGAVLALEGTGR
jgi:two-component system, cell cycle sensor histidine kinase PleC